jgi:DNA-3-methyladenine glycosylase I
MTGSDNEWLDVGADGVSRCWWPGSDEDYVSYHDHEWGRPVAADERLFEKICLEGFQSGLSWLTILRKRDNFRAAFAGFEMAAVADFDAGDVDRLVNDAGIVRHRGKIESAVNNARRGLEIVDEFGSLAAFVWSYEPAEVEGERDRDRPVPATTPTSVRLAKDLKRRGWSFVGPTTVYAFMQAMGLVNDHVAGCEAGDECRRARAAFAPPAPRAG